MVQNHLDSLLQVESLSRLRVLNLKDNNITKIEGNYLHFLMLLEFQELMLEWFYVELSLPQKSGPLCGSLNKMVSSSLIK